MEDIQMWTLRLKELRETTGLSARKFAEELGIPYTTYCGYETGAREPGSDFLIKVAERFGVSVDYIIGRSCNDSFLSPSELEHIKKYRRIDSDGKKTVDMVLDQLVQKAEAESSQSDNPIIPLAAKGGGVKRVQLSVSKEEADEAFYQLSKIDPDA